jgi:hypothetical protein
MFPELVSAWELIKSFWGSARLAGNGARIKTAARSKNTQCARKRRLGVKMNLSLALVVQLRMQMLGVLSFADCAPHCSPHLEFRRRGLKSMFASRENVPQNTL